MSQEQKNNPLHGVKLESLLTELVDHYGFEILAGQVNINCFKSNPSIKSSLKFLRKTPWARNRVEAFYLYRYKNLPRPSDEEFQLPPRERGVNLGQSEKPPVPISIDDKEFFDDPESGYSPKRVALKSRRGSASKTKLTSKAKPVATDVNENPESADKIDPWAKWRNNEQENDVD